MYVEALIKPLIKINSLNFKDKMHTPKITHRLFFEQAFFNLRTNEISTR